MALPKTRTKWTEEETRILRENVATKDLESLMTLLPGKTRIAIQRRREKLGLKAGAIKIWGGEVVRVWTEKDDFELEFMAGRCSSAQIAKRLGRSVNAVQIRASLLGVRLREGWTITQVSDLFQTDRNTIAAYRDKLGQDWRTKQNHEPPDPEELQEIAKAMLSNPLFKGMMPAKRLQLIAEGKFDEAQQIVRRVA